MSEQGPPLNRPPVWRATSTIAKTVYRELRRAGCHTDQVMRFVSEVIGLLTADIQSERDNPRTLPRPEDLIDPENGFLTGTAVTDVLENEVGRLRDTPQSELLLLCLEIRLPDWLDDDEINRTHAAIASVLRKVLRIADCVGRLDPLRYLIILPSVSAARGPALLDRLRDGFMGRRSVLEHRGTMTEIGLRTASWDRSMQSAGELLDRCLHAPLERLFPTENGSGPAVSIPPAVKRAEANGAATHEVVVALGGGAARAFAHVGALEVLRRHGIRPTALAGTSNGALVAALIALGMSEAEILDRAEAFSRSKLYKQMQRAYLKARREMQMLRATEAFFRQSSLAFLSESRMCCVPSELYDAYIDFFVGPDRDVSSLPLPLAACATDLVEGRTVTLRHGSLHAILLASCAVPGLFPPQRSGGRLLVDGAVACEVPIASAMMFGMRQPVVALYLQRPTIRVDGYASSIEVATRATAIAHAELVREQLARAPLLVAMPVQEIGWLAFREARRAAAIGAEAASATVDDLLNQLNRASPTWKEGMT